MRSFLPGLVVCLVASSVNAQMISQVDSTGTRQPAPGRTSFRLVHHVDAGATGANDGSNWADAFSDLQSALAAAVAGEEIWVAAGTYTPSPNDATVSFQLKSGVALYGGFAGFETAVWQRDWETNVTSLDGDIGQDDVVGSGWGWWINWNITTANAGHVVVAEGVDASTVLDGFLIENGATGPFGTSSTSHLMGASGLLVNGGAPTIRNCTFLHNESAFADGAAMYIHDASPLVKNCRFLENYAHLGNGGGMVLHGASAPIIEDCEFARNLSVVGSNSGGLGAGIQDRSTLPITVQRCLFDQNHARPFFSVGDAAYGGGFHSQSFGQMVTMIDCVFTRNAAQYGGGFCTWGPATLINCLFEDNEAIPQPNDPWPEVGGVGAGICSNGTNADVLVQSCTIAHNQGKKHVGIDMFNPTATATLENTIIWGNTATHPEVIGFWPEQLGGSFEASYCDIQLIFLPPAPGEDPIDPQDLPGCISVDPLFAVPYPGGDFHLLAGSPCADAGDNFAAQGILTDLDGNPRFVDDPSAPDTGNGEQP